MNTSPKESPSERPSLHALLTRERWFEIGRIGIVGIITLLYWRGLVPLPGLWAAIAFGLYPLVKTGVLDLFRQRKIDTEIFVTVATIIAMIGGEYVAGAVLMTIILIAEFIAELNPDRAHASPALLGWIGPVQAAMIHPGPCGKSEETRSLSGQMRRRKVADGGACLCARHTRAAVHH